MCKKKVSLRKTVFSQKKQIHSNARTYLRQGDCQLITMSSSTEHASLEEMKQLQREHKSLQEKYKKLEQKFGPRASKADRKAELTDRSLRMINMTYPKVLRGLLNVQSGPGGQGEGGAQWAWT